MQPKRCPPRPDLRRGRRDDVVARQRQLEAAAEADAVDTRNQRDRQQFHEAKKLDAVETAVFIALLAPALLHALIKNIEIGASGKMPKAAAQHDGAATGLLRLFDLFDDGIE